MHGLTRVARAGLVVGLAGVAGWGHVAYPAWLGVRTRRRADPAPPTPAEWAPVTVVIPAYRERAVIRAKVQNTRASGYPGPLEIIVVAEDPETAAAARRTEAKVVANPERMGKACSLNRGVAAASYEWVVLSDADTRLPPGAIATLVRWLADPTVGAVAGEKRVAGSTGEALYWRFESWLKRRETRTGTTIGMSGGLVAVARSAFHDLPADLIADDLWIALDVVEGGRRVVYEPEAVWSDESDDPHPSFATEWERRTRVVSGTLNLMWRRRRMLRPGSPVAAQLWGHRLIRSCFGPLAHLVLLAMALARVGRSRLATGVVCGHGLAVGCFVRWARGRSQPWPGRVLAHLVLLQGVALGGMLRYLRGDQGGRWSKAERDAFPGR